jgi:Asp-tRNA(Asn)/Glu-tRNA(Gln) amidotransferase A subunit family amidase
MQTSDAAWLTATEALDAIRSRELRPPEMVAAHLERITRLNPVLAAYVYVDERAAPGGGRLGGVTLAVKDTQPVRGMPWTYGSRRWRGRVAGEDGISVAYARAEGVALLGKTNTPELAASVGTANELFPPTQNPWRPGYTPGGSSGGSGAAVAAGLCSVAYGDDMGGSVRIPSACCGVLGLRPSSGRMPVLDPDPTRLSVPGPLARSVADLRLAFSLMAAEASPPPVSPARLRVAVVQSSTVQVDEPCQDACRRAMAFLAATGHELEPIGWDPMPVAEAYQVVRPVSVATMPGEPEDYGEAAGSLIATGRATPVANFLDALQAGLRATAPLRELVRRCDAILTPTLGRLPMPVSEVPRFLSEPWSSYTQFVLPVSFAGLPAVSIPAGQHQGLPVGVQLVGRPWGEWALLDLAGQLESAPGFGFERPPSLN